MSDKDTTITASLASYDVNALMTQTRKLAADYRQQTGQALPVTEELARFDAINIFSLVKTDEEQGIDAIDKIDDNNRDRYLIKGRVIFKGGKARQKLGKLSLQASWTVLLMVIYDASYMPTQVYSIPRAIIEKELELLPTDKRGSMTVSKYKAIGQLVWENPDISKESISSSVANKQSV